MNKLVGKGLPDDGLNGWFSLSLTGVQTSRGESGSVKVSEDVVQSGWDVGTMEFSGTIPLLGIQPNQGNARQYEYHILKITEDELRLCAPEPGAGALGYGMVLELQRKIVNIERYGWVTTTRILLLLIKKMQQ